MLLSFDPSLLAHISYDLLHTSRPMLRLFLSSCVALLLTTSRTLVPRSDSVLLVSVPISVIQRS